MKVCARSGALAICPDLFKGEPVIQLRHTLLHKNSLLKSYLRGTFVSYSPFEQGLLLSREIRDRIGKKDILHRNPYFSSM